MILITGIAGLTGRFLYQKIQDQKPDRRVKYFVRPTSDISFMLDEDKKNNVIYGDGNNIKDITDALLNVDLVIHLATIHLSEIITQACVFKGIKRVIFINTTGMYSHYKSYAALYTELEKKIKESNLIYTIIRPTMIYGNHQDVNIHKLIKMINKVAIFPVIGKGDGLMHPIYAQDLANVIISAMTNEEKTRMQEYNVAGKAPLTYLSLLAEIAKALGKKRYFLHIPYGLALLIGKIADCIPNGIIDYEKVQRLKEDKSFDYSKAAYDLGFSPRSFEEGVKLEVQALRDVGIIK
ncbi:Nucleoside-diphosphate-sugar epimerase [Pelosinus fermentans]|uniref:NAD-dependent epimerase/dehydratase family protein n=1 Tax=Pelosinus fermentans TaxID=365349 RepID=UPI0002685DA5|nr:NAD-dependent epimerase/dehydratase family protein [Pelosinus fermentans]OAM92798.1 NAD-dependent epimerase [Pelosinus fermentans DSM 17108]SDQ57208.1 Nucleoside-diphosphate-sugar epimerase [Pelosinus fermentans]